MAKKNICNLSFDEFLKYLDSIGEKSFRAKQIFDWLYDKNANSFDEMKNLSESLRETLKKSFDIGEMKVLHEAVSTDGTIKTLFQLVDGEKVETVLIPTKTRSTICISTQAGCKFGCRFCASGIGGWTRNLEPAEILAQVRYMKKKANERPLSHIVFMGVGEPLDNYDNLLKAIRIINSKEGINIGARRITISTCGVIPKIMKLAGEGLQLELAISLHGSSNDSRDVLMPVNRKYPVKDLIEAAREYNKATKRQITFEYILIQNVTCTDQSARELKKLLQGLLCKMNLIPYNKVEEFDHNPPTHAEMVSFQEQLRQYGVHATVRRPRGRDVGAACGQLRHAGIKKEV